MMSVNLGGPFFVSSVDVVVLVAVVFALTNGAPKVAASVTK